MKIICIKKRYSIEPRDRIYVKGYGFLSFAKKMGKSLSNKYGRKLLASAKKSTTDAIKTTSKRAIQKKAEAIGDLIGNKIADKITSVSKKSNNNNNDNNNNNNNNDKSDAKFAITETKLYVLVLTLSTQENAKLLQQLKSGFKRIINGNKYESSIKTYAQNRYLNHLINPSFQGVNRLFVLSFKNDNQRKSHSTYYLPKVEIKDYNVMIDCKNLFGQPINSMTKTYENIRKIATGQEDDYTTGCLLFQKSL